MIRNTTAAFTNTFTGNVVPNPHGGVNNLTLQTNVLQLIGSPFAVGGTLTNLPDLGANALNLGTMPNGTQIQTWNNGFSLASQKLATGKWNQNPTFTVGQGFFIKIGGGMITNWVQTYN
jgi:hypothetical protein